MESPLVELGRQQAMAVGKALLDSAITPSMVFSSPAVRAMETARIALTACRAAVPIRIEPQLHEQDVGRWAGRRSAEVFDDVCMATIGTLGKDFRPPGGESVNDVGRRMNRWLESLSKRPGEDNRVVVGFTHGGAIRALESHLLGWTHARTFAEKPANGSVTVLEALPGPKTWKVRFLSIPCGDLAGVPS